MSGSEVSYHSTIAKPALAFNNTLKLGRYLGCTQAVAQHVWVSVDTTSLKITIIHFRTAFLCAQAMTSHKPSQKQTFQQFRFV